MEQPKPKGYSYQDIQELTQRYAYHASQVRGVIINEIILLERLMDEYISEYFCVDIDKRMELMDIIVSTKRITFESKSQILRTILERRKHASKTEATKFFNEINFTF